MIQSVTFQTRIAAAVESIRRRWPRQAVAGIILGTGSGGVAEHLKTEYAVDYEELPHFPASTALGHHGYLHCGTMAGVPVIALQGRFHLYEGYGFDEVTLPVHVMRALGARTLIASNASGAVNPLLETGHIVVLDDHIDFMSRASKSGAIADGVARSECGGRSVRRQTRLYDRPLIELALRVARKQDFVAQRGIYAAVLGPNYETRAEYRMFRQMGADVVGMSTVPEIITAAQLGMRSLALSLVTNVACPDAPHRNLVTGEQVVKAAQAAEPRVRQIILEAVQAV